MQKVWLRLTKEENGKRNGANHIGLVYGTQLIRPFLTLDFLDKPVVIFSDI